MEYKTNHEAVVKALSQLNQVKGIDTFTLTKEAADEISNLLGLDSCETSEDLRAIRNSVVMVYSAFDSAEYRTRMSAIVAVIDSKMMSKFKTL